MYSGIACLLELINNLWSNVCEKVIDLMMQTPDEYNKNAWNIIVSINQNVFIPVSVSLVAIFFLISFCEECLDLKQEMRLTLIIKSFIKLSIAECFVVNNLTIIQAIFKVGSNLAKAIKQTTAAQFNIVDLKFIQSIDDLSVLEQIPVLLITVVAFLVALSSSIAILYIALTRFFKFLCVIPFGAFAGATIAGNHRIANSASSFYKFIISASLEAVTIVIALFISNAIISSGGINLTGILYENKNGSLGCILMQIIDMSLSLLFTASLMKTASSLVNKALAIG